LRSWSPSFSRSFPPKGGTPTNQPTVDSPRGYIRHSDQFGTCHPAAPGSGSSYTAKNAGVINLKSASYNPTDDTVALTPAKPFALTKPVQLVVYASSPNGLQDTFGRYINGGKNAIAILPKGGATIEAVEPTQSIRPAAQTPAIVDALLSRDALAGLRHPLRRESRARRAD
jgi:hypothetical protein